MEIYTLLHMLYSSEHIYSFGHELELQLNTIIDKGIDGFLDLFDSLGKLMKSTIEDHAISVPLLNKNSVLGLYVRRIIIFFEKLPFDQAVLLYEDFKNYVKKMSRSPDEEMDLHSTATSSHVTYQTITKNNLQTRSSIKSLFDCWKSLSQFS